MARSTTDTSAVDFSEVLRAIDERGPMTWQDVAAATFDGTQECSECGRFTEAFSEYRDAVNEAVLTLTDRNWIYPNAHCEYDVRDGVDIDDYTGDAA